MKMISLLLVPTPMDRRFPPTIYSKMVRSGVLDFQPGLLFPDADKGDSSKARCCIPYIWNVHKGDEISVPLAKKKVKVLHENISGKAYDDWSSSHDPFYQEKSTVECNLELLQQRVWQFH
ncbi:hypothetical protein Pyn_09874 [Prunus yedoensis var. nudiflora]|uniref:Uncharacterized protein n=1 Tax=Prunus yedoensis var. nudiflora TaxID=2094558 RepID=A0A314Z4T4_PRUYE|nr:hypothetical protein Pyn_09874 [Prunus yedoensis var. nudiflora]